MTINITCKSQIGSTHNSQLKMENVISEVGKKADKVFSSIIKEKTERRAFQEENISHLKACNASLKVLNSQISGQKKLLIDQIQDIDCQIFKVDQRSKAAMAKIAVNKVALDVCQKHIMQEYDAAKNDILQTMQINVSQTTFSFQQVNNEAFLRFSEQGQQALQRFNNSALHNYNSIIAHRRLQIASLRNLSSDYWNYVQSGIYTIYNTHYCGFLYAADYEPFDGDRRRIFLWIPGNVVNQGYWRFERNHDGTLKIKNIKQQEYLYAADYMPYDRDRRSVFSWRPGSDPGECGSFRLELQPDGNFLLFNTYQHEYLYAAMYKFDYDRRMIFTWRPGVDPGLDGRWQITRVN